MSATRDYRRASEVARYLVACYLDEGMDHRREIVRAMRGAPPLAMVNLIEILVIGIGDTYESLEEFSKTIVPLVAQAMEEDDDGD